MLNLLRYSQLLALAVLTAVVVALSLLYRGLLFDSMVESETHANIALTKTFANAIWPSHARFVSGAASLPRATLASREEIAAIDRDLRRLSDGLSVVKVKIYDLNGLVVYSTDPRQIGEDGSAKAGFRRARDGYPSSKISYRERLDSWEGALAERHVVETYVPVHVYDAAPVEAVLEVYNDVTEQVIAMQRAQWKILAAVLGAMASSTRCATAPASCAPRTSSRSTVNSSPPMRKMRSASRTALRMRSAATRSNRSPASCPRLSFTRLKRSRSRNRSASGQPARLARRIASSRCSVKLARLGNPVSASW